jgi:hypothetical protein
MVGALPFIKREDDKITNYNTTPSRTCPTNTTGANGRDFGWESASRCPWSPPPPTLANPTRPDTTATKAQAHSGLSHKCYPKHISSRSKLAGSWDTSEVQPEGVPPDAHPSTAHPGRTDRPTPQPDHNAKRRKGKEAPNRQTDQHHSHTTTWADWRYETEQQQASRKE